MNENYLRNVYADGYRTGYLGFGQVFLDSIRPKEKEICLAKKEIPKFQFITESNQVEKEMKTSWSSLRTLLNSIYSNIR